MDTPRRSTWQDNRARRSAKTRRLSPPHPRWAADPPFADPPEDETPPSGWRSAWQGLATGALVVLGLGLLGLAVGIGLYAYYARTLPSPEELYERAATFQSARIYDRSGRLLFEFFDPEGGRRTVAAYEEIPDVVVHATVATEDASFFTNPGVSPLSTARALWQDLRAGEAVYGGSTITQQVVKNLFLTRERTVARKVQEAILATELTRRYSKEEILTVYLNDAYFGNLAYGISAAADTYFGKDTEDLELHEAALLAGLIQAPVLYDPYAYPDAALARRGIVLGLMQRRGYIDASQVRAAKEMPLGVRKATVSMRAPHMVMHVREQLEELVGERRLYREGLQVHTTLDLDLQEQAEEAVRQGVAGLAGLNATNAALVSLDPHNGDILAMVGSADFWSEEISGQVNVALQRRQPGSTIKPLTYLAALERGWTAGTLLMDVEQSFPDGANPPYRPVNFDGQFWGPVSMRSALATSRNIPAVSALEQVGLSGLLEMAGRLGITTLTRPDYGLALTLGGGEVTLLQMTSAYGALANGGYRVTPRAIAAIYDPAGKPIYEPEAPAFPAVVDPRHAYVLTDILADNAARTPAFGAQSALALPFPAAGKTGTTNDYRDGWIIGYTPNLVTGVWVGNSDNTPMAGVTGSRGAGPIFKAVMLAAPMNAAGTPFARPGGIVEMEVCPVSGHPRGDDCPPGRTEIFVAGQVPSEPCPVHTRVEVCLATGKRATELCPAESVEVRAVEDYGPLGDAWAVAQGKAVPPREECDLHTSAAQVDISLPPGPLSGIVDVYGSTEAPGFLHYYIELGAGAAPDYWQQISPPVASAVGGGVIFRWDTGPLEDGVYSLRLVVLGEGGTLEAMATAEVRNAPATAEATLLPIITPSVTPTLTTEPTATPTPPPADTPEPTAVPTATPEPDIVPSPEPTTESPAQPNPDAGYPPATPGS